MDRAISRSGAERGVVAVEFVLIAPLLLLLIFGMIQFGRAYNVKVELTSAVREGVRALSLGTGDPVEATIAAAPGLDETALVVTTSEDPYDPDDPADRCASGSSTWVEASYDFELAIPFWRTETITIGAKGVMRCGG